MSEESKETGQTITLPDGRQLGYLVIGEGKPVFYLHGFPGSGVEALCLEQMANARHLQIIAVDRPGFGSSTYAPNRTLRDHASEIAFLADKLGIREFALIGLSGGGVFALTCAVLLSKRLTRVVVISGGSLPMQTAGMTLWNRIGAALITVPIVNTLVMKMVANAYMRIARDPDALSKSWTGRLVRGNLPEDDFKFIASPSRPRDLFLQSWVQAQRQGPDAIKAAIQHVRLLKKGWEVDLSQIPSGLVHIWHGSTDTYNPVEDAYRNAKAIPGAHLKVFENEGHLSIINHLEELGELLSS